LWGWRVKQWRGRRQPITGQGVYPEVWKDIGKIAASRRQQQNSKNETPESKRFYQIAGAVGENRCTGIHPGHNRGVTGKSAEKMFFSAMNFHRLNPAKHLVRLAIGSGDMRF